MAKVTWVCIVESGTDLIYGTVITRISLVSMDLKWKTDYQVMNSGREDWTLEMAASHSLVFGHLSNTDCETL